jgi:hypothetical protein
MTISKWTLFEKYVMNEFLKAVRRIAEVQPLARIFPGSTALPEIPPAPLF